MNRCELSICGSISSVLMFVLFAAILCAMPAAVFADEVYIADPYVRAGVYDRLYKDPSEPLTQSDMDMLESLKLWGQNADTDIISSFAGLEYAGNLDYVSISRYKVTDSTIFGSLTQINALYLENTTVDNLDSIYTLSQLNDLRIRDLGVDDISGIGSLNNLQILNFSKMNIDDYSTVSQLNNLQILAMTECGLSSSDLQFLTGMTYLPELYLDLNSIDDISFLSEFEDLEYLYLFENNVSDISPLANMRNLKGLDLSGNPLNDEAYQIYIPQIIANNPDIELLHNPIPEPSTLACMAAGMLVLSRRTGGKIFLYVRAYPKNLYML